MIREIFLDRYEAINLLGQGGMGRVFLGRQLDNGRDVVIKVMHDHFASDPRFRQAFQREMLLMTRFRHPYAVTLFDASPESDERPCIVMEYVQGDTLSQLVERYSRLPAYRVGLLLSQLGQVLQSAHDNGIIHRDLSPVNVMVVNPDASRETVKVMDFGLARIGAGPYIPLEKLTGQTQSIGCGTPDFVPPEQIRGEPVDHRGDIYAVGVLLYKLLTGYLPFEQASTTQEILKAHLECSPPSFSDLGVAHLLPPGIEGVVMSCLAKQPEERPQNSLDLVNQYEKALGRKILLTKPIKGELLPATSIISRIDPRSIMDQMEAWMPEPIAIVKLRGFAHDYGGEFIDSEPGAIRFRLPDPTRREEPSPKSFLALWNWNKKPVALMESIVIELRMEKKETGTQNILQMTVMMRPEQNPERIEEEEWRGWCQQICRDLRAYMISR